MPTSVSTYLFFFQLGNKKQLGPKKQRRHNVVRYTFCLFGSEERVKEISAQISSALADEQFTRDLKAFKSSSQLHQTIVTKLQLELTALPPEVILPDLGSDSQKTTEKDDPSSVKKQAITGLAVANAAELPVKTQKPTTVDPEKEVATNQRQDKEYFVTKDFLLPQEGEEGLTEQLGETSLGEDHFVTSHPDSKATIEETTDDISEYLLRFYYRDQKLSDHFTRTKYFVHSVPEPFLILREFGSYQTKTIDSQLATHQDDPFVIHQPQLVDDYDLTPKGVSDFQDQTYHAVDLQSTPDTPPFDDSLSDLQQESFLSQQTQSFPAESLVEFQQEQLEVEEEQEVVIQQEQLEAVGEQQEEVLQQEVVSDDLLADDLEEQLPASSLFTDSQAITAEPELTPLITSSKPSSDQLELITDQHHLPQQEQLEVPLPTGSQLPVPILELPEPLEKNQKQQIILLCGSEPFPGANQAVVTAVQRLNDFDNFAVDFAGVINGKKVKLTESRIRRANLVLILPGARKLRQFPVKLRVQVAYENLLNHSLPTVIQSLMVVYKRLNQPIPTQ